jgi:hypothetical protein
MTVTTPIIDDFNRANETLSQYGRWTSGIFGDSGLSLSSNQVAAPTNDFYSNLRSETPANDCEAYVTVNTVGSDGDVSLYARVTSPSSPNGYAVSVDDGGTWTAYRVSSGGYTALGSTVSQALTAGDGVGIRVSGTTITALYRSGSGAWTNLFSRSDSAHSSGQIGLELTHGSWVVDNFGGGALPPSGDFAKLEAISLYQVNTTTTSHSVNLPVGIEDGDKLLMLFRAGTTQTASTPSGWDLLASRDSSGVTYIFTRDADGTEGSSVTVTTGGAIRAAAQCYRFSNCGDFEAEFAGSNTSDPPSITPTWGEADNIYLALVTKRRSDGAYTGAPTNYHTFLRATQTSSTNTNRANTAGAHRHVTSSTSENPGAFSTSGTIDNPHAATVAIQIFTEPSDDPPTVTTQAVTNITYSTATGNGNVTDDGGATVTERGVVAATSENPTTSDLKFEATTGGTGAFTAAMTELDPDTQYYIRAYAINSEGTSYGSQVDFTTDEEPAAPPATRSTILDATPVASGVSFQYPTISTETAIYTVTTTAPDQTHTINSFGVAAATKIDWGDGSSNTYTGTAQRNHTYSEAGEYTVTIYMPGRVRTFDLRDSKATIHSLQLATMNKLTVFVAIGVNGTFDSSNVSGWTGMTQFRLYDMAAGFGGVFNSTDVSGWTSLTQFHIHTTPAGFSGTFNSSDLTGWTGMTQFHFYNNPGMAGTFNSSNLTGWTSITLFYFFILPEMTGTINSANLTGWTAINDFRMVQSSGISGTFDSDDLTSWNPSIFIIHTMPGLSGTFDTADASAWNPTAFSLYNMSDSSLSITVAAADFTGWLAANAIRLDGNNFSQAQVNAILWGLYQASVTPRTATGGTINVAGSNAAPSGTFQAAASCPVTSSTPGKEVAHELLNDGCGESFNTWATVTTTA